MNNEGKVGATRYRGAFEGGGGKKEEEEEEEKRATVAHGWNGDGKCRASRSHSLLRLCADAHGARVVSHGDGRSAAHAANNHRDLRETGAAELRAPVAPRWRGTEVLCCAVPLTIFVA